MTGHGPDANLTTAGLVKVAGIVDPIQMWANFRGVI